jgi:hypothetical protein
MEKLHQLIKSLSGMEKRYFKLAVSIHKDSKEKDYMHLFEAISRQKKYDEPALRQQLQGKKMMRRFDMSKDYLYKLLLNTLQGYHRDDSIEQKLLNMLDRAAILHSKMLFGPYLAILEKARRIAKEYEYYEILLKIIQMILRVAIEEKKDRAYMEAFHKETEQAIRKVQRINEYHALYHRIYSLYSEQGNDLRVKTVRKQYQELLKHPLLSGKEKPEGYEEKSWFYMASALGNFCLGNSEKSYEFTQQRLDLIHHHPWRMKEDPDTYIITLNYVVFYGSVLSKIRECEHAFHELRNFLKNYPAKWRKIFIAYDNMMALYITAGRFREGIPYAKKAGEELEMYSDEIFASNKVSLYHDMFYIYFGCREYSRSLEWLNKLLNEASPGAREDIQVSARITNLILHYELGNFDLLPYLLRRTYRYLIQRKRLHQLEKILLSFMSRLLRADPDKRKEMIPLFEEMKKELEQLARKPNQALVLTEYFDYLSWLESKITKRSFERIVREKTLL